MTKQWTTWCNSSTGQKKGTFYWILYNPIDLTLGDEVEIGTLEAGGFKWKLELACLLDNCDNKSVKVFVFSTNDVGVSATVALSITSCRHLTEEKPSPPEKTVEGTRPYSSIIKECVPIKDLTGSSDKFDEEDKLIVYAKLDDIQEADSNQQRASNNNMGTVKLVIIDKKSISAGLRSGNMLGLASSNGEPEEMPALASVQSWARSFSNCRYWLCKRCENGRIFVEKCLHNANAQETFASISEQDDQAQRRVTVFKEEKEPHKSLDMIGDNTMIVFCKLYDSADKSTSYLRHCHIRKTEKCHSLLETMAVDIVQFPEGRNYDAFLEKGDHVKEITMCRRSLEECGVLPGSIIILKERKFAAEKESFIKMTQQACVSQTGQPARQGNNGNRGNPSANAPTVNTPPRRPAGTSNPRESLRRGGRRTRSCEVPDRKEAED